MKNYTKKYNHFTIQDRKNLKVLYNKGKNYTEIGYELGKNRRSIQRELARNSKISFHSKQKYYYSSGIAQQKAQHRKFKPKIKEYKFNQIRTFFEHHLDNKMNIEQIYLQFKLKHPNEKVPCIQTIYN
jgi:IS30 family transposase